MRLARQRLLISINPCSKPNASDQHYLKASKTFTIFWGLVSITFRASCLSYAEKLNPGREHRRRHILSRDAQFVRRRILSSARIGGTAVFLGRASPRK